MALGKELLFKCRLNDLGTTIVCGGTDTFTNKSARKLMYQIMVAAANGLVTAVNGNDTENALQLCYESAINMLRSIMKPEAQLQPLDFSILDTDDWEITYKIKKDE